MKEIDISDLHKDAKAEKFHFGIAFSRNDEKYFALYMTDINGKILAYGAWPKSMFDNMRKEFDDIWDDKDIKNGTILQ